MNRHTSSGPWWRLSRAPNDGAGAAVVEAVEAATEAADDAAEAASEARVAASDVAGLEAAVEIAEEHAEAAEEAAGAIMSAVVEVEAQRGVEELCRSLRETQDALRALETRYDAELLSLREQVTELASRSSPAPTVSPSTEAPPSSTPPASEAMEPTAAEVPPAPTADELAAAGVRRKRRLIL